MSYRDPPDGYTWDQVDALRLRCERCGETVTAGVVDLHERRHAVDAEHVDAADDA